MAAIPDAQPGYNIAEIIDQTADALVGCCFTTERSVTTVQLELYVAAIRRPALRSIADHFTAASRAMYAHYTDADTAELLTDTAQGMTLRGIASDRPPGTGSEPNSGDAYRTEQGIAELRQLTEHPLNSDVPPGRGGTSFRQPSVQALSASENRVHDRALADD
ncbi:ABC-F family ATP-binding cassette domain-containing protein [Nocardia brasiliensis]|uniref:ABC-F family ATP-binding cassette domain-containing protein n=1 Tax=Nocardia brasiliensis TaxID=37326 RepID=UPI0004A6DF9B|nr:ABC-F family ATP-binding cassette domain-containing protein [Nocardia brasiliensis]